MTDLISGAAFIGLTMVVFYVFARMAFLADSVEDLKLYTRNLQNQCNRLGDENDALRARVAKLEKGEHV